MKEAKAPWYADCDANRCTMGFDDEMVRHTGLHDAAPGGKVPTNGDG